ncbi:MAG: YceD family protein [Cyanobacteriota bacterium]|nr:YceD family protein [Cyanobacteriota bacterium]
MDAIFIPQLLGAHNKTETIEFQEFIPDLETLTPVRGTLSATHHKTYLEVKAKAETIVTLCCDRCLQHYNHRLVLKTSELIWLEDSDPNAPFLLEREVALEDLSETLPPHGYFQPKTWLYEQLCLALPVKQLCGAQCQGIAREASTGEPSVDRRWASLEALKDRFSP